MGFNVEILRNDFPALASGLAFFDAPGGTQIPVQVADAVRGTSLLPMSNRSPASVPGRNAEAVVKAFREAGADLAGAKPEGVVHGRSATQLTMDFSRALSKGWGAGDNIVLSRLDHDANVAPWLIAAKRVGVEVRWASFDSGTAELNPDQYDELIDDKTRIVAVTAASNFVGTKPDVRAIADKAHAVGALVYVDAVHYAAHDVLNVDALGADFAVMSPYKLFGPHFGMLIADPGLLETVFPDKLRPSPDLVPERFELGTLPYEQLAGVVAVADYLAQFGSLGDTDSAASRRSKIVRAMQLFDEHELRLRDIIERGVAELDGVNLLSRAVDRTSTLLFTFDNLSPVQVEASLAESGIVAQAGHFYAKEPCAVFGLGETGGLRVGLAPYNTDDDVRRLLDALGSALARA